MPVRPTIPASYTRHTSGRLSGRRSRRHRHIVAEFDIRPTRRSALRCRVLVFKSVSAMRIFCNTELGTNDIGTTISGVCVEMIDPVTRRPCDPRYFAVIGLLADTLDVDIITHECVHAAFAYSRRVPSKTWGAHHLDINEEVVCYPAGNLTSDLLAGLLAEGLLDAPQVDLAPTTPP